MSITLEDTESVIDTRRFLGDLSEDEIWWRDHQVWLQERGYMLRPRYRPGWVPSWKVNEDYCRMFEDGRSILRGEVLDATRLADNTVVVLKQVMMSRFPYEVAISRFFSTGPLADDPRNHCVPIYEVLDVPDDKDLKLLVMPLLHRFEKPRFLTIGEAIECCRQLIEGLSFMHDHHVAHRDIMLLNIMMDPRPLFPNLFHFASPFMQRDGIGRPKHYTRTGCPTKYFYIDFGLSRKFNPAKGPPRSWPIWGGDKSVPEFHKSLHPCDPFPTDIYYLGNTIRKELMQKYIGLDFLQPLVSDMTQEEPSKRPTIHEVAARFDIIIGSLSSSTLRTRLPKRDEHPLVRRFRVIAHTFRTLYHIIMFRSPLPRP
ncbi:kinase-like domain-containing protein [Trametes punicea]|nr:kinase-like domain-containing protein [Trametes punicea]